MTFNRLFLTCVLMLLTSAPGFASDNDSPERPPENEDSTPLNKRSNNEFAEALLGLWDDVPHIAPEPEQPLKKTRFKFVIKKTPNGATLIPPKPAASPLSPGLPNPSISDNKSKQRLNFSAIAGDQSSASKKKSSQGKKRSAMSPTGLLFELPHTPNPALTETATESFRMEEEEVNSPEQRRKKNGKLDDVEKSWKAGSAKAKKNPKAQPNRVPSPQLSDEEQKADFLEAKAKWSEDESREAALRYPILTPDQQNAIVDRANGGDIVAQQEIIARSYNGLIDGLEPEQLILGKWVDNLLMIISGDKLIDESCWFIIHFADKSMIPLQFPELCNIVEERARQKSIGAAKTNLAILYFESIFKLPNDAKDGTFWLNSAAKDGDPLAQLLMAKYHLGSSSRNKRNKRPNPRKALPFLQEAALHGMPAAQGLLAELYERGDGTEQNLLEACRWKIHATHPAYQHIIRRCFRLGVEPLADVIPQQLMQIEDALNPFQGLNLTVSSLPKVMHKRRDDLLEPVKSTFDSLNASFTSFIQDLTELAGHVQMSPVLLTSLELTPKARTHLPAQQTPLFCHEWEFENMRLLTLGEENMRRIESLTRLLDASIPEGSFEKIKTLGQAIKYLELIGGPSANPQWSPNQLVTRIREYMDESVKRIMNGIRNPAIRNHAASQDPTCQRIMNVLMTPEVGVIDLLTDDEDMRGAPARVVSYDDDEGSLPSIHIEPIPELGVIDRINAELQAVQPARSPVSKVGRFAIDLDD
jgi:TPR repeat protein